MPPDNERGRPHQEAAPTISTPIKIETSVPARVCLRTDHDSTTRCPLHGCPDCARERFEWEGSEELEKEIDYFEVEDLVDACADELGCLICDEIVLRRTWAAYPGAQCELADCLHCESCDACHLTAPVCRTCDHCVACEDQAMGSPCELYRWDRVTRTQRAYFQHSLRDPITGRWGA